MRLIDADKAKTIICKHENRAGKQHDMIYAIECLPTIEAEPVRHGRWIDHPDPLCFRHWYECSECYCVVIRGKINFCPNCGAKMDAMEENYGRVKQKKTRNGD